MDVVDCYRLLGLRTGASFADIKSSYRRLAHQYHPDINPDDNRAKEKFIAVTEAYKLLLQVVPSHDTSSQGNQAHTTPRSADSMSEPKSRAANAKEADIRSKQNSTPPNTLEIEERLKWTTYEQLQDFLKKRRFPQAIALAEALAQRLPNDSEVRQWQAISYQLWAKVLIKDKQFLKARIYLKKALKTDPNNKSLVYQVQQDLQRLK